MIVDRVRDRVGEKILIVDRGSCIVHHETKQREPARFEASKLRPASSLPKQIFPDPNFCGFYAIWLAFYNPGKRVSG